jgi:hypothetical protein
MVSRAGRSIRCKAIYEQKERCLGPVRSKSLSPWPWLWIRQHAGMMPVFQVHTWDYFYLQYSSNRLQTRFLLELRPAHHLAIGQRQLAGHIVACVGRRHLTLRFKKLPVLLLSSTN